MEYFGLKETEPSTIPDDSFKSEKMDIDDFSLKTEPSDLNMGNLTFHQFEMDQFILPDVASQDLNECQRHIKTEPTGDTRAVMSIKTENIPGTLQSVQIKSEPDSNSCSAVSEQTEFLKSEMVFEESYFEVPFNVKKEMPSPLENRNHKMPIILDPVASQAGEEATVGGSITVQCDHNTFNGNGEMVFKSEDIKYLKDENKSSIPQSKDCTSDDENDVMVIYDSKTKTENSSLEYKYSSPRVKETQEIDEITGQCFLCKKTFTNQENLKKHLKIHRRRRKFKCRQCAKLFNRKGNLQKHVSFHTKGNKVSSQIDKKGKHKFSQSCDSVKSIKMHAKKCIKKYSPLSVLLKKYKFHIAEKPYKCIHCEKIIPTKRCLITHDLIKHTEVKLCKCGLCGKLFSQRSYLTNHQSARHTHSECSKLESSCSYGQPSLDPEELNAVEEQLHRCNYCELTFSCKSDLSEHIRSHKLYIKCNDCGETFSDNTSLSAHIAEHLKGTLSKCYICGKEYEKWSELKLHLLSHVKKRFECTDCSKIFASTRTLEIHQASCVVKVNDRNTTRNEFPIHKGHNPEVGKLPKLIHKGHPEVRKLPSARVIRHKCKICGMEFIELLELHEHLLVHSNEKSHTCNQCGEKFANRSSLITHTRGDCTINKCYFCEMVFRQWSELKEHLNSHAKKCFKCKDCGETFSDNASLISHHASCTKKVVLKQTRSINKCYICEMEFRQWSELKEHLNSHANKRFKCKDCGETFSDNASLICHHASCSKKGVFQIADKLACTETRLHSCPVCEMEFTEQSDFQKHIISHTTIRHYKCEYCQKQFRELSDLHQHLTSHTDTVRYKCNICKMIFCELYGLQDHIMTHTNEKRDELFGEATENNVRFSVKFSLQTFEKL